MMISINWFLYLSQNYQWYGTSSSLLSDLCWCTVQKRAATDEFNINEVLNAAFAVRILIRRKKISATGIFSLSERKSICLNESDGNQGIKFDAAGCFIWFGIFLFWILDVDLHTYVSYMKGFWTFSTDHYELSLISHVHSVLKWHYAFPSKSKCRKVKNTNSFWRSKWLMKSKIGISLYTRKAKSENNMCLIKWLW